MNCPICAEEMWNVGGWYECPACGEAVDPTPIAIEDTAALDNILRDEAMDDWLTARDEPLPFDEWEANDDA